MKHKYQSYSELAQARNELKTEINTIEKEIANTNFVKFTSSILGRKSTKNTISDTLSSFNISEAIASPVGNLIASYLLSNKLIRKYFVGYTILKESAPFVIEKIKTILSDVKSEVKKDLEKDKSPNQTL